jgi:hypothetical protein
VVSMAISAVAKAQLLRSVPFDKDMRFQYSVCLIQQGAPHLNQGGHRVPTMAMWPGKIAAGATIQVRLGNTIVIHCCRSLPRLLNARHGPVCIWTRT